MKLYVVFMLPEMELMGVGNDKSNMSIECRGMGTCLVKEVEVNHNYGVMTIFGNEKKIKVGKENE